MTKVVTAIAALHAVQEGVWALDDDMRPHAPELAAMKVLRGFDAEDKPILEEVKEPITLK
jgi:CubicO group peptidase (beta-lactamase class C family)